MIETMDIRITVPQADDLDKVLEVASLVADGASTSADIADKLGMVERQGLYYATAAAILGMVTIDDKHVVTLTDLGRRYNSEDAIGRKGLARHAFTQAPFVRHILADLGIKRPSWTSHRHLLDDSLHTQDAIEDLGYAPETALRRAFTIRAWIKALS